MVKFKGIIDNVFYYIDNYQENNKLLKGRKTSDLKTPFIPGITFIIGNEKTINQLFNQFRKEKIMRLLAK